MGKKAIEVVAGILWRNDRFLACRRSAHKARALQWEFAGGKVEPGESREQALVRELKEELAVTVEPKGIFTETIHEYPDVTIHLTLFHAVIAAGEPKALEHCDLRWVTPQEADGMDFCPADRAFVEKLLKEQKGVPAT